jgi:peptidoglycan/LPS O-acetylase OafA/YrhL
MTDTAVDEHPREVMRMNRIQALDGMRGVSILAVTVFHSWIASGQPAMRLLSADFAPLFALGQQGANAFFMISGFILFLPVVRAGGVAPGYRKFLARRLTRVLPPYYVALTFWAVFWVLLHDFIPHPMPAHSDWLRAWPRHLLTHATFTHVFWFETIWSLHGPLWWVATLVHMYLLFPLLARAVWRWPFATLAVSLPGLAWSLHPVIGTTIVARLPFFLAGMVAAIIYNRSSGCDWRALRWAGRAFAWRPLGAVGNMAYSLLLYNLFGYWFVQAFFPALRKGSLVWWVVTAALLFALAGVAYVTVERPAREWRRATTSTSKAPAGPQEA